MSSAPSSGDSATLPPRCFLIGRLYLGVCAGAMADHVTASAITILVAPVGVVWLQMGRVLPAGVDGASEAAREQTPLGGRIGASGGCGLMPLSLSWLRQQNFRAM